MKTINPAGYRWLLRQIRPRIPSMLVFVCANMLAAYLGVIFSLVIKQIIDSAVSGEHAMMVRYLVLFAGIILVQTVCSGLAMHLSETLRATLDRDMKKNIMHKILHSEYHQISAYHSGDLVNRMNSDVHNAHNGVLAILASLSSLATSLVTAVAILLNMAPGFTVAICLVTAVIALFTLLIQRHMKKLHKASAAAAGKISGFFQEAIGKLLIIQALDVSDEIEKRSDVVLEQRWQIQRRRKNIMLSMNIGSTGLSFIASFITLLWCSVELYHGNITFGELTAITALIAQLQDPMLALPSIIPKFTSISAACERIMEIEEIADQPPAGSIDRQKLYASLHSIRASGLAFSYDRDPIFRDVSLDIPKGGLTVIVGASGIGKSTLLKLMLGIYRPSEGSLTLQTDDGAIPVSRSVRSLFTYAPQGNLLLSGTLRENILLARPDATEEQLRHALYVSAMDTYVDTLPDGLDTVLGENGAGLSEGQAQRISLARAVLSDAPILLLDEVTSSLDPQTERTVLERITALPGKTCIAVTHRPAALELANRKITVSENHMELTELSPGA